MTRSLIIGALGQVGQELAAGLARRHGAEAVVMTDLAEQGADGLCVAYERLDVLDPAAVARILDLHRIDTVYMLAATLSASGERRPHDAWNLNMTGLLNVLELASRERLRVFWPSSIAVFGPSSKRVCTPQHSSTDPSTVYGISKLAGEGWCAWYRTRYGVDVRSLRFPGLISHGAPPGGGTTDYAVEVFHAALDGLPYRCFLAPDTCLPMMYMPDAVRATIELMEAPVHALRCQAAYNLAGMSFTPEEIVEEIRRSIPGLVVSYTPDERQSIARSWPQSVDDSMAREHWGWRPRHDLASTVADMLEKLRKRKAHERNIDPV